MKNSSSLLAAVAAAAAFAAAGAHAQAPAQDRAVPTSWSMQTETGGGRKTIVICADQAIEAGFARALPEVNGQPCILAGRRPVMKGELFAARCRSGADLFDVHSVSTGDPAQDFVVDTTVQTDAQGGRRFEQQIHYRKVSSTCPKDWRVGDSGAPGDTKLVNALSGATRTLAEPIILGRP